VLHYVQVKSVDQAVEQVLKLGSTVGVNVPNSFPSEFGKRAGSRYEPGKRTGAWIKIKLHLALKRWRILKLRVESHGVAPAESQFQAFRFSLKAASGHSPLPPQTQCPRSSSNNCRDLGVKRQSLSRAWSFRRTAAPAGRWLYLGTNCLARRFTSSVVKTRPRGGRIFHASSRLF
jgi:hypothetical protein